MITFKAKDASGEIIKSALSPFTFPAGEAHIKKSDDQELQPTEIAILQFSPESMAQDIMQYLMWTDYIGRHNMELTNADDRVKLVLVLPYAPAARADRGNPFGAQVYSFILSAGEPDQIIVFDPHSPVIVDELSHFRELPDSTTDVVTSQDLFAQPYQQFFLDRYDGIIAPDKGALVRAKSVAELNNLPVYTVEKKRNFLTGKLEGFDTSNIPKKGKFLIVDDICDGGGTFIGIAKATGLKAQQLDLYISHGVFSGEAEDNLPLYFDRTFTTNSFNPQRELVFTRFDVIRLLLDRIK